MTNIWTTLVVNAQHNTTVMRTTDYTEKYNCTILTSARKTFHTRLSHR